MTYEPTTKMMPIRSPYLRLLSRTRVLAVEDENMVAMLLCSRIVTAGHEVVGPIGDLVGAIDAARHERIDCALLDIKLNDDLSYPVADALDARHIPYAFVTSYPVCFLRKAYADRPFLAKPFTQAGVQDMIETLMRPRPDEGLDRDGAG